MIVVRNLHKCYEGKVVLDGVDLNVESGQTVAIVGPSGVGKSVFLRQLIGLERPDSGDVFLGEWNVPRLRRKELYALRQRMGVVFQTGALLDSMTVEQNVRLPLRMHTRGTTAEVRARVDECLELVGMSGTEGLLPEHLSVGMRRRVGIARALALEPKYMFYDEPTAGLDPKMARVIGDLIGDLQREVRMTSVLVTHDMDLATRTSDRIALLYEATIAVEQSATAIASGGNPLLVSFMRGDLEPPEEEVPGEESKMMDLLQG